MGTIAQCIIAIKSTTTHSHTCTFPRSQPPIFAKTDRSPRSALVATGSSCAARIALRKQIAPTFCARRTQNPTKHATTLVPGQREGHSSVSQPARARVRAPSSSLGTPQDAEVAFQLTYPQTSYPTSHAPSPSSALLPRSSISALSTRATNLAPFDALSRMPHARNHRTNGMMDVV